MAKILPTANIVGLALFLALAFLLPLHSESEAQRRFGELRQQGAITSKATHAPAGEMHIASWIAQPAITGERAAANIGIALTLLNVSIFVGTSFKKSKK